MGSITSVKILEGNGILAGKRSHAERETDGKRQDFHPDALEAQALRQPIAAGEEQLGFLPPDRYRRYDRYPGLNGGPGRIQCDRRSR